MTSCFHNWKTRKSLTEHFQAQLDSSQKTVQSQSLYEKHLHKNNCVMFFYLSSQCKQHDLYMRQQVYLISGKSIIHFSCFIQNIRFISIIRWFSSSIKSRCQHFRRTIKCSDIVKELSLLQKRDLKQLLNAWRDWEIMKFRVVFTRFSHRRNSANSTTECLKDAETKLLKIEVLQVEGLTRDVNYMNSLNNSCHLLSIIREVFWTFPDRFSHLKARNIFK